MWRRQAWRRHAMEWRYAQVSRTFVQMTRFQRKPYDVEVDPLESEDLSTRLAGVASELHREMSAMCRDLQSRSAALSASEIVDMAENQHKELRERLRSVGYIRDEQETETAKCPPPERPESAG